MQDSIQPGGTSTTSFKDKGSLYMTVCMNSGRAFCPQFPILATLLAETPKKKP